MRGPRRGPARQRSRARARRPPAAARRRRASDGPGPRRARRPGTLLIDLWGEDAALVGDELLDEVEGVPALQARSCRIEPLVETVHGTLGGRLGLEWFDLELLDQDDAEAARAEILERLEARGLQGDAQVEISDDGAGRREVKIRIEAKGEFTDP
ncbi:hypothetical protein [Nannocystis pusilla]|uniref:hypothetical protein n=1 Tax=Nannocystis pusilla TaxID=889268 RepID=UPI003B82B837